MSHEQPPPLAAHRDETLSVEAAQQLVQMAAAASQAGQTGRDLPLAAKADLYPNALPKGPCQQNGQAAKEPDDSVKLPVALREDLPLTLAEAQKMRQILNDPGHTPHCGKEMSTADASVLVKKLQ